MRMRNVPLMIAGVAAVGAIVWIKVCTERKHAVDRIVSGRPPAVSVEMAAPPPEAPAVLPERASPLDLPRVGLPLEKMEYPFSSVPVPPRRRPETDGDAKAWQSRRSYVQNWAARDPEAAAQWAFKNMTNGGDLAFAMRTAAFAWAGKDPGEALAWADRLAHGAARESALSAVLESWARRDPAAAAEALAAVTNFSNASAALGCIAYHWSRKDQRAALAWAWKLPEGAGRTYALSNVAREMRRTREGGKPADGRETGNRITDPTIVALASLVNDSDRDAAARRIATRLPGGRETMPVIDLRVGWWASGNARDAVEWAKQLPKGRDGDQALAIVAQAAATKDPKAASEAAGLMSAGEKKKATVRRVAAEWAKTDAVAASAWAGTLPPDGTREAAVAGAAQPASVPAETAQPAASPAETARDPDPAAEIVFNDIFFQDVSLAIAVAEQLPDGEMREGVVHAVAVEWARTDPVAALSWATAQLPAGRVADTAEKAIVWEWTQRDFEAAAQWAGTLENAAGRERMQAEVALALVRSQPSVAAEYAAVLPPGETRNSSIGQIAYQWAARDVAAASEWAVNMSAADGRDYAVARVAACRAASGVDGAITWASSLPDGPLRDSALGGVAGVMALSDLNRAVSVGGGLSEGVGREQAFAAIGAAYGRKYPGPGTNWIYSLSQSRSRDAAAGAYAAAVSASDTRAACDVAATVGDPEIRLAALRKSLETWKARDETAATAWIASSALAADEKEKLLRELVR